MERTSRRILDDISHVFLLLFFLATAVWYLIDTLGASQRVENIIFVGPVAVTAIALSLYILIRLMGDIRGRLSRGEQSSAKPIGSDGVATVSSSPLMNFVTRWRAGFVALLFTLYVMSLNVIGFDVSTFLFVMGCLIVQGERNPLVFVGYSLVFAALLTYAFRLLVPYPFTTLLF